MVADTLPLVNTVEFCKVNCDIVNFTVIINLFDVISFFSFFKIKTSLWPDSVKMKIITVHFVEIKHSFTKNIKMMQTRCQKTGLEGMEGVIFY